MYNYKHFLKTFRNHEYESSFFAKADGVISFVLRNGVLKEQVRISGVGASHGSRSL